MSIGLVSTSEPCIQTFHKVRLLTFCHPMPPKGIHIEPLKVSESMFRQLKAGTAYILVYGKLEYDSVFGAHHWITFCQSSGPTDFTHPKECVDYNDVDNNEEP